MAWRQLELGDSVWNVTVAAERRANATSWHLVLAFREAVPQGNAFWTSYPIESASKSALFAQADRLTDDKLAAVLSQHLR